MEQRILVTGATDGLGRGVARDLARRGHTLLVHGRDADKAGEVAAELGGGARPCVADLASLEQVRRLAAEVLDREERLDVLVNNAGVAVQERRESADGHELTFAVNHLAHFLLTLELLPLLERSAPARIVNVASIGQAPLDFEDPMLERGYDGFEAYRRSKLAQISFTFELAERLGDGGVTVNALHPATLMDTKMVRESFGRALTPVDEGDGARCGRARARRRDRPLLRPAGRVHRPRAGIRRGRPPAPVGAQRAARLPAGVSFVPGGRKQRLAFLRVALLGVPQRPHTSLVIP